LEKVELPDPVDLVIQQIKDLIHAGILKPGDRLPSEKSIEQKLQIPRGPINKALRRLETYGILKTIPQSGTYVASIGVDALFATHIHGDHFCPYMAAAVVKNTDAKLVGPRLVCETWKHWGVPEDWIVMVKPGDSVKVKDTEVLAVDSFDRTVLITSPPYGVDFKKGPLPKGEENFYVDEPNIPFKAFL